MAVGITAAGKRGILIKGGAPRIWVPSRQWRSRQRARWHAHSRQPSVIDVIPFVGSAGELLAMAAGIERFSEHPLARAIVQRAARDGITPTDARDFTALTGAGAKATIGESTYYVGNPDLFQRFGANLAPAAAQYRCTPRAARYLWSGARATTVSCAAFSRSRTQSPASLRHARRAALRVYGGVCRHVLTGDNERTARAVALQLAIDDASPA